MSPFSQLTGRRRGSVWPMVGSVSGEEVPGLVLPPATGCVSLSFLWRVRGSVGSVPGRVGACEVESCCSLERLEQRPGDHLGRIVESQSSSGTAHYSQGGAPWGCGI